MTELCVIFFGTTGAFSAHALASLLTAGLQPAAVTLPALAPGSAGLVPMRSPAGLPSGLASLPVIGQMATIVTQARAHRLPVYELGRGLEAVAGLHALAPDVCCVACWPWRIPPELLNVPRLGWLNAHPSSLPQGRGPDPLFWLFHSGADEAGITVHLMSDRFDAGPILAQRTLPVEHGETESALERRLAQAGGPLLAQVARGLAGGETRGTSQDKAAATWQGWPTAADFVITPRWPARRAFTFAAGISERAQPVIVEVEEHTFTIARALGYETAVTLPEPYVLDGDILRLRCADGVFEAHLPHEIGTR